LEDGDVQPAIADRVAAVLKPAAVAELGEDRNRAQLANPVIPVDQRPAASLPARVVAQLLAERRQLHVQCVGHLQADRDLLARHGGQCQGCEPVAAVALHQLPPPRGAVVIEHGLDPLLPLRVLLDQCVPQPHLRAQIENVIGRNPRLRQPPGQQQLAVMAGVRAIGLRAPLGPAPRRGFRGLGQMLSAPTARSSSTRNRQPVVASSATSSSWPANRSRNRRTPTRSAGLTRVRLISPLPRSIHSAVICARCWSTPITIDIRQTSPHAAANLRPFDTLVGGRVPSVERPAARL
jgi:hypothetical protein